MANKVLKSDVTGQEIYDSVVNSSQTLKDNMPPSSTVVTNADGTQSEVDNLQAVQSFINSQDPTMASVIDTFVNQLVGKVVFTNIQGFNYTNELKPLKKGLIEVGAQIENAYTDLIAGKQFAVADAQADELKFYENDIKAELFSINREKKFAMSVTREMLSDAFTSWEGVNSLVATLTTDLNSSDEYDEFKTILDNLKTFISTKSVNNYTIDITGLSKKEKNEELMIALRGLALDFKKPQRKYNVGGVMNNVRDTKELVIFIDSFTLAKLDVTTLAAAFNMDKSDFIGRVITVPEDFFTTITGKTGIQALITTNNFFQIWDKLFTIRQKEVASGLYWNYFLIHRGWIYQSSYENFSLISFTETP